MHPKRAPEEKRLRKPVRSTQEIYQSTLRGAGEVVVAGKKVVSYSGMVKKMDDQKNKALEKIDQITDSMSHSPIVKGLIDGGLSLIPFLGTAITTSLDTRAFQLFEENSRRPFLPEKAEILNIPPGPWRRDLVLGQTVSLPDGRQIKPEEVLGPERPGTKFVHVGDTGRTQNLIEQVHGADTLVIESTYIAEETEMADRFGHLTAARAAQLAVDAEVKNLLLTHLSRRYRERDVLAEAREIFPNTFVARDFDTYQIRRGECEKLKE